MKKMIRWTLLLSIVMIAATSLFCRNVKAEEPPIPPDAMAVISNKISQEIAKGKTCEEKLSIASKGWHGCEAKLEVCTATEKLEHEQFLALSKNCLGVACPPGQYDAATNKCKEPKAEDKPKTGSGGGKKGVAPPPKQNVNLILCVPPAKPSADRKRCECPESRLDSKGNRGVVAAKLYSADGITYGACVPTIQLHDDDIGELRKRLENVCVLDKAEYNLNDEQRKWLQDHADEIDPETMAMLKEGNDLCRGTRMNLVWIESYLKHGGSKSGNDYTTKLNQLIASIAQIESRLNDLENRVKGLEGRMDKAEADIKDLKDKYNSLVRPRQFHFQAWAQGYGIFRPTPQKPSDGFLVGVNTMYCFTERHCALVGGGMGYEHSLTDRFAWDLRIAWAANLYVPAKDETFFVTMLLGPEAQGGYPRRDQQHSMIGGGLLAFQFRFNHIYLEPSVLVGVNESVYRRNIITNDGTRTDLILSDPTWGIKPALTLGVDIN